jgi:hypothetical protein
MACVSRQPFAADQQSWAGAAVGFERAVSLPRNRRCPTRGDPFPEGPRSSADELPLRSRLPPLTMDVESSPHSMLLDFIVDLTGDLYGQGNTS